MPFSSEIQAVLDAISAQQQTTGSFIDSEITAYKNQLFSAISGMSTDVHGA